MKFWEIVSGIRYKILLIKSMAVINIKIKLQYGKTLKYEIISYLISYPVEFLAVRVMFNNFQDIGGCPYYHVLFLQAISFVIISLSCAFVWEPMAAMESYIIEGKMDYALTMPINPFLYLAGTNFRTTNLFITLVCGGAALIAAYFLRITWSIKILFYIIGILGGIMFVSALHILIGALSFWTFRSGTLLSLMIDTIGEVLKYPIAIYPKGLQLVFTFVLPVACVNDFPARYLLKNQGMSLEILGYVFFEGMFLLVSYKIWTLGLRRYQSAGG